MTVTDIFAKISHRQVVALMFHSQLADYFDFLNLHGFKRWHEYQYLAESIGMRKTHRYHINHHSKLVPEQPEENPNAIPMAWYGVNRFDVENKHQLALMAFEKWRSWEQETKVFLSDMYVALQQQKDVAAAGFVSDMIEDVDCELKGLERALLTLRDCSMDFLLEWQEELHECYKGKTEKVGKKLV